MFTAFIQNFSRPFKQYLKPQWEHPFLVHSFITHSGERSDIRKFEGMWDYKGLVGSGKLFIFLAGSGNEECFGAGNRV